jgi:methionyl-tRNA formyltransferase
MRVVFVGTPAFAVVALRRLVDAHDVIAVYSQPPRPAGRGQKERLSPVHAFAAERHIAVHTPTSLRGADVQAAFVALAPDVAVVAAYGLILPRPVLAAPKFGCINIHASLLPRWRGAAPIQRAIMAGDNVTGVTIMQMEPGLDTGPILLKREVPVTDATTASALHDQLAEAGADAIVEALGRLAAGTLSAVPQPPDGVTHAPKIEKAEARINFDKPAHAVIRHIHALSPAPGAWFEGNGERIKVLRAEAAPGLGPPGTVIDDNLSVAVADGAVRFTRLQRSGRAEVDAAAFQRGFRLAAGTVLA